MLLVPALVVLLLLLLLSVKFPLIPVMLIVLCAFVVPLLAVAVPLLTMSSGTGPPAGEVLDLPASSARPVAVPSAVLDSSDNSSSTSNVSVMRRKENQKKTIQLTPRITYTRGEYAQHSVPYADDNPKTASRRRRGSNSHP